MRAYSLDSLRVVQWVPFARRRSIGRGDGGEADRSGPARQHAVKVDVRRQPSLRRARQRRVSRRRAAQRRARQAGDGSRGGVRWGESDGQSEPGEENLTVDRNQWKKITWAWMCLLELIQVNLSLTSRCVDSRPRVNLDRHLAIG